jgi:hypothetical protein
MKWTEEDRRRASEQQSRMQRARDESLRLHQQRQSAIQARHEAVRRKDHEKYIRVQQSRVSQTFTNLLQSSTRPSVASLSLVQAPAPSRSKDTRGKMKCFGIYVVLGYSRTFVSMANCREWVSSAFQGSCFGYRPNRCL